MHYLFIKVIWKSASSCLGTVQGWHVRGAGCRQATLPFRPSDPLFSTVLEVNVMVNKDSTGEE